MMYDDVWAFLISLNGKHPSISLQKLNVCQTNEISFSPNIAQTSTFKETRLPLAAGFVIGRDP